MDMALSFGDEAENRHYVILYLPGKPKMIIHDMLYIMKTMMVVMPMIVLMAMTMSMTTIMLMAMHMIMLMFMMMLLPLFFSIDKD